jgi:hypothetical protein
MEEDMLNGLFVVVIICLIVIAFSSYQVAFGSSYMTNAVTGYVSNPGSVQGAANLRFAGESSQTGLHGSSGFVGNGANEAPVFWNMGSVEETNAALQAASAQKEEGFTPSAKKEKSGFVANASTANVAKVIKSGVDFTNIESFAGKGY